MKVVGIGSKSFPLRLLLGYIDQYVVLYSRRENAHDRDLMRPAEALGRREAELIIARGSFFATVTRDEAPGV